MEKQLNSQRKTSHAPCLRFQNICKNAREAGEEKSAQNQPKTSKQKNNIYSVRTF